MENALLIVAWVIGYALTIKAIYWTVAHYTDPPDEIVLLFMLGVFMWPLFAIALFLVCFIGEFHVYFGRPKKEVK